MYLPPTSQHDISLKIQQIFVSMQVLVQTKQIFDHYASNKISINNAVHENMHTYRSWQTHTHTRTHMHAHTRTHTQTHSLQTHKQQDTNTHNTGISTTLQERVTKQCLYKPVIINCAMFFPTKMPCATMCQVLK